MCSNLTDKEPEKERKMKSQFTFIDVCRTMPVCHMEQWHQENTHKHKHAYSNTFYFARQKKQKIHEFIHVCINIYYSISLEVLIIHIGRRNNL